MNTPAQTTPKQTPGSWLTRQMELRTISVRQLAEALNVTTKTVYDWRDDRTAISEERVPRLAEIFGIPELEARRGLGYWVPAGTESEPAGLDREELSQLKKDLQEILERIDRLGR